jgi:DNA-binding response OmpR family regulator
VEVANHEENHMLTQEENRKHSITAPGRRRSEERPPRVLLAEDDAELRRFLATTLRRDGYEVIEAKNGDELLSLIGSQILSPLDRPAIDLVVSDIRMPGQSGLRVLASLRRADWGTPVVLITAFGDRETHEEARRLGAVAVFDKPFDIDDLRTVVMNVIGPATPPKATPLHVTWG